MLREAFHCKTIPLALRLSAAVALRLTEAIAASLRSAENKTKPSGGRRRFKTPFHSTNDLRCILAGGDFNTKKGALKSPENPNENFIPATKALVCFRETNAGDYLLLRRRRGRDQARRVKTFCFSAAVTKMDMCCDAYSSIDQRLAAASWASIGP